MRLITIVVALASALLSSPVLAVGCTPYAFTASKDVPLGCCKWVTVFSQVITTTGPVDVLVIQMLGSQNTQTNFRIGADVTPIKANPWDNQVVNFPRGGQHTIKIQAQSIPGSGYQDTFSKGSHLSLLVCPQ
jgi:hypothetical protein